MILFESHNKFHNKFSKLMTNEEIVAQRHEETYLFNVTLYE